VVVVAASGYCFAYPVAGTIIGKGNLLSTAGVGHFLYFAIHGPGNFRLPGCPPPGCLSRRNHTRPPGIGLHPELPVGW